MNKTVTVILTLAILIVLPMLIAFASYVSANNYGAKVEAELRAARDDNQNILAQYQQKILEAAQVPDMYRDDLGKIIKDAMTGRYGDGGSKATFQWIQENNLSFDSKLYTNIQDLIAGGRKDFENGQRRMIDIRKGYEAQRDSFWRGMWLGIAGYPKINFDDYKPVITDRVEETFKKNKEDSPIKLR
jgi:hypothetical protein